MIAYTRLSSSKLPLKILQFGTGRFVRAFADFFINAANQQGKFGGHVVMVASTNSGRTELINMQHGQYTLWTRGYVDGQLTEKLENINVVHRALSAQTQWATVLKLACNPTLAIVISNTTEIGLSLQRGDKQKSPNSYPARLTAILHERARHFEYAPDCGLIVLPCELIDNNGDLLRELVLTQAQEWALGNRFYTWLREFNLFCNTLVDRIVPGLPSDNELESIYQQLGRRDTLLTVTEPYRLWAIEGDSTLSNRLGFTGDPGIVITPDIAPFRTRKIRLLNGGHTLSVPLGLLTGCRTVLDNMQHPNMKPYIEGLLRKEIGPVLNVDPATVSPYIDEILDRWSNPFMHHRLLDIMLQSTSKMRHRVVPTLVDYYRHYESQRVPHHIALGFAAWLRFMRGSRTENGCVYGAFGDEEYIIHDAQASRFLDWWPVDLQHLDSFVQSVLTSKELWGMDLTQLAGFEEAVARALHTLVTVGPTAALMGT